MADKGERVSGVIKAFGHWFASSAGVWQTVAVLAAWIALEKLRVVSDPSGYQILYWLTVYSAVTQPVLAWIAADGSRKADEVLRRLEAAEQRELELLEGRRGGGQ